MEPLVSIIVPVYNTENLLLKCVNSIIAQTYQNIEIILINDGSTDQSLMLCQQCALIDRRIVVHSQKNSGVSSARNQGLKLSRGEYVCFIDSDDYVDEKYIASFFEYGFADCVIGGIQYSQRCSETKYEYCLYEQDKGNIGKGLAQNVTTFPFMSVHCKLLKRNIIEKYSIQFDLKLKLSEDTDFLFTYFLLCNSILTIPYGGYYYHCCDDNINKYLLDKDSALYTIHKLMYRYECLMQKYKFQNENFSWYLLKVYCNAFFLNPDSLNKNEFIIFLSDVYVKKYFWMRHNDSKWAQLLYFLSTRNLYKVIYYLCKWTKRF